MWEERMQGGMFMWLLTLAEGIDAACCNPGELANVRANGELERAAGLSNTIDMSVQELAAACQRDAQMSGGHNGSPELAVVARLFM